MVVAAACKPGMVRRAQEEFIILFCSQVMHSLRIAIICDLLEENWPSMNFVADMLAQHLQYHPAIITAKKVQPRMIRRLTWLPGIGNARVSLNADRLLNRFEDYPRYLRSLKKDFDIFHIIDHSYAQLAHELPPERTIITCHDLDTFRCLLDPTHERRGRLFKAMTKRIFDGFCKAARVICVSHATRDELLGHGLLPAERVVVIHNGVDPDCAAEPDLESDMEAARWLGPQRADAMDILHVGSTIPRKRIDVLLEIFASIKHQFPQARLLRAGGTFTATQASLAARLGLRDSIVTLPFLSRSVLSAVYRRAALVLQPSENEGFGLPVAEALACGVPVVASDLPVLKEVGGEAAVYCPVANVDQWSDAISKLLHERQEQPDRWALRRERGIKQAANFDWAESTRKIVALYQEVAASSPASAKLFQ